MRVPNRGVIRRLSRKTLKASRTRNLIAVLAIALTTVLFTALFTIGLSMNDGFQQNNFRQCGGWCHGSFKYLTEEQYQELKDDPLIRESGLRRFVGMPTEVPFNKAHVEVGYSDAKQAHWMYCDPVEGRLPAEGTNEAATDTRVLSLLGVEPEIGAEFTVTFQVDGHETTQTFTLCGWWEYDEVIIASHILIPESRAEAIYGEVGADPTNPADGMTGTWNLDVMFKNSLHIDRDMEQVLANHGYQSDDRNADNYIGTGVNWGYTGSQLATNIDPGTALAIIAMVLLIVFTGYLIIYNVFQISVAGDIRFYGLLKTIGTTPRQLKRIIRQQALLLSAVGIPLGLVLGWLIGAKLTPVVIAQLDGITSVVSVNPLIFVGAAVFSLITVLLSCDRPGRMAAKVSPVEAVRYTEGGGGKQKTRKGGRVSLLSMARANLGRSRSKTVVTILSLSLAVVLLTMTVTFAGGFDMDKYLTSRSAADFIVADAGQFQTNSFFSAARAVPEEVIDTINAQGGIAEGGRIYGKSSAVEEFITEAWFRSLNDWSDEDNLNLLVDRTEHTADGLLADGAQLYGMEPYILSKLTVLEGDLSKLNDPDGHYIAAVYSDDDYGNPEPDSHWAKLGDTVTLRYVEEYEYYNPNTGEIYPDEIPEGQPWAARAKSFREVDYEVAALVVVPLTLSYRYFGSDEFVLGSEAFLRDTGTDAVMLYAFDMADDASTAAMESFLENYTETENPQFDYESKATYAAEFDGFRNMFLLLGSALSFVVGLVGVLNYINAVLTGIITRKRELAMLQSIGMTGAQLKRMLQYEGLLYALGAVGLALVLALASGPLLADVMEGMFWFFSYHLTLWPILILLPVFALLGIAVPSLVYRSLSRSTIVERLRDGET